MTTRVLVVRFSSLGDVVLVAPALIALKKRLPDAHLVLLTRTPYAGLHRLNPAVAEIWPFDPGEQNLPDLVRWVRGGDFDLIVDLHASLRSRLLTLAAGVPVARWRQERWKRFLIVARPPLKRHRELTPIVDLYLHAVGCEEAAEGERTPVIVLDEAEQAGGRSWRKGLTGERSGRCLAILPGAKHPPKEWPLYRVRELAALLVARGDLPIIIPPPDDPEPGRAVGREVDGALVSEPLEDVMDLASALAACDGVVANDSGPMHLAAAVGTPTVGLFGPTSPALGFAPRGVHTDSIFLDLYCSPCSKHGQRVCWRRHRECLNDIGPREVIDRLEALIRQQRVHKTLDK